MPQKNRTVKGVLGGLLGLVGLSAVAGILVTATVTPAIAVVGSAGSNALKIFDSLPNNLDVTAPMEPSAMWATGLDGNPVQLATFYEQIRTQVSFDQISTVMYDAILSSEDKTFYEHGGINIGATAKALIENVLGSSERGASTISQQYVKNVLIQECEQETQPTDEDYYEKLDECWVEATNTDGADGLERKLKELRYAVQIEKEYSKKDILLGYLNLAGFGGNIYVVEAAEKYYFSTTAANLTVAQAATLAGMVQNPNALRIDMPEGVSTDADGNAVNGEADGYSNTLERRNYVLGRMLEDNKITQAQYDEAIATPITPAISYTQQGCAAAGDDAYFCQYVKESLLYDDAYSVLGDTSEERAVALQRGGLQIYTSLDLRVQEPAVAAMDANVPASDGNELGGAGVSIEPSTGRILSMTQNTTFSETVTGDQSYRAMVLAADIEHGGSSGVAVGSTYKLFTLLDWLENGHSINETLNGVNRVFTSFTQCDGTKISNSTKINNYQNVSGYVGTVLAFTRASLNSGYLAMAQELELCDINAVADRMNVTLANGGKTTDSNTPFEILGSKTIAPLSMASAYATIANGGIYCAPMAVDRIVAQDGSEMELPGSTCERTVEENIAATAAYTLEAVMTSGGTGSSANVGDGVPVLGKTGTNENYSTMMIESTTNVTTAVWVGRIQKVQADDATWEWKALGTTLSSARYAIAKATQKAANAVYGGNDFPAPDENLIRTVYATLPNVVGKTISDATSTLEAAGFTVVEGSAVDSDAATNVVAAQSPSAGQVASGTTVTISPSNGQGATVPDVAGRSPGDATTILRSSGFSNVSLADSCSDDDATVSGTDPSSGSSANMSTTITIACSS